MSEFWTALGVIAPILTAMGVFAYKKPRQYERLMNVILFGSLALFVVYFIYGFGYMHGSSSAFEHARKNPDADFNFTPLFENPLYLIFTLPMLLIGLPGVLKVATWIKEAEDEKPDAGDKNT